MQKLELINQLELALPRMTPEEQEKAKKFIENSRLELAREDFYSFVRLVAPEIIPGGDFKDGNHLRLYCNELQNLYSAVIDGNKYKLQFHLPPGAMKTLTCCLFVAWVFGKSPEFYILHIGHTIKFAEETFGQKIKDILVLPIYRFIFPKTIISKSTRSKGTWKTTKGGTYHATGAGNAIAGKRAHILICDDVLSEQTAISKTERNKINAWYIPGARSRLLPASAELIVNTRWNIDDLSGHIIKVDKAAKQADWKIISIPAILEGPSGEEAAELLGLPVGGSYWPEFWPIETFEGIKATAPPHVWNSLYMQNPVPSDGVIFNKKHFNYWDEFEKGMPVPKMLVLTIDPAFSKEKKADYTAWQLWGVWTETNDDRETIQQIMLYAAGKKRLSYPELVLKIKELHQEYDIKYCVIEKKASGQSLIQDLRMQGFSVHAFDPGRDDKETRANMVTPFLEAGLIWVPEHAPWSKDFVQECLEFPSGAHDDQVDAFTQLVLWFRNRLLLTHRGQKTIVDEDEDDHVYKPPKKTYWSVVKGRYS